MKDTSNPDIQSEIDFRFLFSQVKAKWPILLIAIFISLLFGWYFFKTSTVSYQGKVSLFLVDRKSKAPLDVQSMMGIKSGYIASSIDNEQELLKSTEMIKNALTSIDWQVSYYAIKKMNTVDAYKNTPFTVSFDPTGNVPVDVFFEIEILNNNEFNITAEQQASLYSFGTNDFVRDTLGDIQGIFVNIDKIHHFGDTINISGSKFTVHNKFVNKDHVGKKFKFNFNNLDNLAKKYSGLIEVAPSSENSSVLIMKLTDSNPILLTEVINAIAEEYIRFDLKRKNEVALKTIKFIDEELSNIRLDLSSSENNLESYKISNRFLDLGEQASSVFRTYDKIDEQRANLEILKKYYQNIKKAIENNKDASDIALPSNAGTDDPILLTLLNNYILLTNEKINLKATAKEKNPAMIQINGQITQARKNILDLVINKLDNINLTLDYFNKRETSINSQISTLPTNQRNLVGFERTFNLHNQLFIFLLQRRAEAQITAATNVSDSFIIDPCKSNNIAQIAEKKSKIYLISSIIGLLIGLIIILGPSFIYDRYSSEKEIENASQLPIVGHIPHVDKKDDVINPRSMLAEAFRKLRTNINYIAQGENNIILLLASDMPRSGKTFTAMNLSNTYAGFNKKTLIISADMRKSEVLEIPNSYDKIFGLSDYLTKSCTLDEIITPSETQNLYFIQSGPIPPNSAELLDSNYCKLMFEELKQLFDVIIIDAPAYSLFADTNILMNYSDINLLIIRIKQSNRSLIKKIMNEWSQKSISNPAIIINDITELNHSDKYGYTYYGYDKPKGSLINRLIINRSFWPFLNKS